MPSFLVFFCLPLVLGGCTSSRTFLPFGVVAEHAGYVPARTAVLPCRVWPSSARFRKLPLGDMSSEELQRLCEQFDLFVLKGFEDQPYMRGYSPKSVLGLLDEAGLSDHLNRLDQLWQHTVSDCLACENAPSFYKTSIASRTDWRLWLVDLSKSVRFADAVLVPFVLFGTEYRYDDRGIATAKRSVGSALFLIETSTGELLWSSGRRASALNQSLAFKHQLKELEYPDWLQVYDRAFQGDLWADFPGRQEFK